MTFNYPVLEKPQAIFDEYEKVKASRAITSLDEFPSQHRWMLDEVIETLRHNFGNMLQYWLVSSWVNGGWVTKDCPQEWKDLKKAKRTWGGIFEDETKGRKVYSDFDIVIRWPNGLGLASWDQDSGKMNRIRMGIATKSGLLIDIYPEKEDEMKTAILLNPDYNDLQKEHASYRDRVERY